jgi:hypothetical protein
MRMARAACNGACSICWIVFRRAFRAPSGQRQVIDIQDKAVALLKLRF